MPEILFQDDSGRKAGRRGRNSEAGDQLSLFYTPRMFPGDDGSGLAWFLDKIFCFSLDDPVRFMKADFTIRK